jgi:hypothetical protein
VKIYLLAHSLADIFVFLKPAAKKEIFQMIFRAYNCFRSCGLFESSASMEGMNYKVSFSENFATGRGGCDWEGGRGTKGQLSTK